MNADQKACLRAAEMIERYGWIKGRLGNEHVGYCILGACVAATNEDRVPVPVRDVFAANGVGATYWNDNIATKEQVIDVLIAAAYGDWT